MRKILPVILALILVLGLVPFTQAEGEMSLTAISVEAKPGDDVEVSIKASDIAAADFVLTFDATALEYTGYSAGASDTLIVNDREAGNGRLAINAISIYDNYDDEACIVLGFKIGQNARGPYELSIELKSAAVIIGGRTENVVPEDVRVENGSIVTPGLYTVTFVDGLDGQVIDVQEVMEGHDATPPAPPEHEGYVFIRWQGSYTNVTSDTTVTAVYRTEDAELYTISYYVDGEFYDSQLYEAGDEILPLEEPVREGYVFSGWNGLPEEMPAEDIRVDGTFTPAGGIVNVAVTASEGGTASLINAPVAYGANAEISLNPDEGYCVWYVAIDGEMVSTYPDGSVYVIENVIKDITVKVVFKALEPSNTPEVNPPPTGASSTAGIAIGLVALGVVIVIVALVVKSRRNGAE